MAAPDPPPHYADDSPAGLARRNHATVAHGLDELRREMALNPPGRRRIRRELKQEVARLEALMDVLLAQLNGKANL